MIGYPFDSHLEYDEHDIPVYDRAISSGPLKNLIAKLFSNGVLPNPSTNLQVVTGGAGMTVIVKAGFCIINGGLKLEDEDKTLVVQASDNTHPRIDTVVMRWNDNDDTRACDLYIVEGTPSANPTRPALTRTGSVYELGLADIYITARSTSIDSFRITDTRIDTARCGYISSISEFDTSTLYAQIQSDLNNFQENEQADFLAWFEEMRDQLSEDAAGNLQLQIDNVNGRYDGLTEDINAFRVVNQLPEVGAAGTLYLVTGEEETHFAGNVDDNKKIINDNVITTDSTFSSLHISDLINRKVDAEEGKGLSKNDFTDAFKTKLNNAPTSFKTINGESIVGTGNIVVQGGGGIRIDDNAPSSTTTYSSTKIEQIKGTKVEANPALTGTESTLDGLKVDGTMYKVTGGISNPPEDPNPEYKTPVVYPHEHWLMGGASSGHTSVGDPCRLVSSTSNVTTYSVDVEAGETITVTVTAANNKRVGIFNGTTAEVMADYKDARGTFLAYETSSTLPSPDYTLTYKNETNATQAYFFYMTNSNPPAGHSFNVTSDVQINTVVYPSVNVAFEHMGFDANGEVNDDYTDASSALTAYQTKRRSVGRYKIKAGTSLKVAIPDGISAFYVYEFTAKNEFISKTQLTSNGWHRTGDTTTYVAFEYTLSYNRKPVVKSLNVQWYGEMPVFVKRPMFNGIKNFVYDVIGNRDRDSAPTTAISKKSMYTTGRLQLPVNYTDNGKPVKLIIYCHSSSSFQTWNAVGFSQTASARLIQYLVDEGYAVYDSYGRSSDMEIEYPNNKHVFGTVDNMNCLVSGYKWVIDNYNIDKDGCYTMCKSLGGLQALNLCWSAVPVKACAALAPALDPLSRGGGYTNGERAENAEVLDYSGDTSCLESSIALSSGAGTIPDMSVGSAYRTLMSANKEKWIGYLPMWNGLTDSDIDNLLEWTYADMTSGQASVSDHGTTMDIMKGDQNATNWANLHRTCKSAIKIWSAPDDENVPYSTAQNFIKTLQNGNCIAELRTMPSGTGGHLSVDTSPLALKQSGTTRNGIAFTDIASAYVEAVQFLRRFE